MDNKSYREEVKLLEKKHKKELGILMREYADANSAVKIGDFVSDHMGAIKVERIFLYGDPLCPSLIYCGAEYTKKLQRKKSGNHRNVYQINVDADTGVTDEG